MTGQARANFTLIFLGNRGKLFFTVYLLKQGNFPMIIGKIPCFLVIKFVTIENRNLWLSEDKLTFLSLSKGIYFQRALTVGHGS